MQLILKKIYNDCVQQVNAHPDLLVLAIDFDGCSDTVSARKLLKNYIVALHHAQPHYKEIILMTGSLRQTVWFDFMSAIDLDELRFCRQEEDKYASCSVLDTQFMDMLKRDFDHADMISFDDLLTNDIYYDLEKGTTLACMKGMDIADCHIRQTPLNLRRQNRQGESVPLFEWTGTEYGPSLHENGMPRAVLNKLDICYIQTHYIAQKLGERTFTYQLLDDRIKNLAELEHVFLQHPTLLPHTCCFQGHQFAPVLHKLPPASYATAQIKGCGQRNKNYIADMRAIRNTCPHMQDEYDQTYFIHFSEYFKLNPPLSYLNFMYCDKNSLLILVCIACGLGVLTCVPDRRLDLAPALISVGLAAALVKFGLYTMQSTGHVVNKNETFVMGSGLRKPD